MWELKKKESLGAKESMSSFLRRSTSSTYSMPSRSVKASSWTAVEPASRMWYPEIEIVFHLGTFRVPNSTVSLMSFTDGSGGHMRVFWAMNSLSMSFWIVPPIFVRGIPWISAAAQYMAQRAVAGGLIVIEVVILSRGTPLVRTRKSSRVSMATPHLPHSPRALGESVSYPMRVGKSKAVLRPVWPSFRSKCHRALVVAASPIPENMRKVQYLPR